jgi:hypothetical protein
LKKILILSYSKLDSDPRILRQLDFLGKEYEIITSGFEKSGHAYESQFLKLQATFPYGFYGDYNIWIRRFIRYFLIIPLQRYYSWLESFVIKRKYLYLVYYWDLIRIYDFFRLSKLKSIDLIIANDLETLPLAIKLSKRFKSKVYFDAHEYTPYQYGNDEKWLSFKSPYYIYLCKTYIPQAEYCTTVSKNIAINYEAMSNVKFDLIFNSPSFQNLAPSSVNDAKIKFIHHGGSAVAERNILELVRAFNQSDRNDIELHLMLMSYDSPYGKQVLEEVAKGNKIHIHGPVPTEKISCFINQFDVGLYFLPPLNFNQKYALPNKIFEFIQARLMLLVGPSVEMAELVNTYKLGFVANGFDLEDIASSINRITPDDVREFKLNSHNSAYNLSSDYYKNDFVHFVSSLLQNN